MSDDGYIRREKKPKAEAKPAEPAPAPTPEPTPAPVAETPAPAAAASDAHAHENGDGNCAGCARLRSALRETRKRLRRMIAENRTLREELLSAGEMIEDLAGDLEKPL